MNVDKGSQSDQTVGALVENGKVVRVLPRIGDVPCTCPKCEWKGTVNDCEPDVDGDGSLGCPKCGSVVSAQV